MRNAELEEAQAGIKIAWRILKYKKGFPGGSVVKNTSANADASGDTGLIPGLGRSLGEGNGYPPSILAWRIPWAEEPGGLQSIGSPKIRHH